MSEIILSTQGLTKTYGNIPAVSDVNLTVNKGDIYGFVGKNGAGKTTFMRMISGLASPTSGSFELLGARSSDARRLLAARGKICAMIETPAIYMNMTAQDNMKTQCLLCNQPQSKIRELLETVELSSTGTKKAVNFSLGMKQRLGLAMAILKRPEFMLLDEPTNGLDPDGIQKIRNLLLRLNAEQGITIMVSSHILGELKLLATRYGFIHNGKLINEISAADIEKSAKPASELYISDVGRGLLVLRNMGIECTVSQGKVIVYGDFDITAVAVALKENSITLHNLVHGTFDLEKYFMELIGNPMAARNYIDPFGGGKA